MILDSHGGVGAWIFAHILFGVVIPVAPAMASAWWCSQLMTGISTKEAMRTGAATGTVAFFAWLFYSWPRGYFVWLAFPTAACFTMAAISMVVTFILCYWQHNRKISPPNNRPCSAVSDHPLTRIPPRPAHRLLMQNQLCKQGRRTPEYKPSARERLNMPATHTAQQHLAFSYVELTHPTRQHDHL